jgi:hypothetical protein
MLKLDIVIFYFKIWNIFEILSQFQKSLKPHINGDIMYMMYKAKLYLIIKKMNIPIMNIFWYDLKLKSFFKI